MKYICVECKHRFENPKRFVETHGFDEPPYEILYGCPLCGGNYEEYKNSENYMSEVIGWVNPYETQYESKSFGDEQRQALVEIIRKRHYFFTYSDHLYLPYCAPFYKGNYYCELTKQQFDSVMDDVYSVIKKTGRLTPMDALKHPPKNTVLYEKNNDDNTLTP